MTKQEKKLVVDALYGKMSVSQNPEEITTLWDEIARLVLSCGFPEMELGSMEATMVGGKNLTALLIASIGKTMSEDDAQMVHFIREALPKYIDSSLLN